MLKTSKKIKRI